MRRNMESPLLNLPAELRNKIYNLAIGGGHIQIPNHHTVQEDDFIFELQMHGKHPVGGNLTALSAVCHQLYTETALLPFSLHTFCGYKPDVVDFLRTLTDTQRAGIKVLRIQVGWTIIYDVGTGVEFCAASNQDLKEVLQGMKAWSALNVRLRGSGLMRLGLGAVFEVPWV